MNFFIQFGESELSILSVLPYSIHLSEFLTNMTQTGSDFDKTSVSARFVQATDNSSRDTGKDDRPGPRPGVCHGEVEFNINIWNKSE